MRQTVKTFTTPPGGILSAASPHPDTDSSAPAVLACLASLGISATLEHTDTAPQVIAYHINLNDIRQLPQARRAIPAIEATTHRPATLTHSQTAHLAIEQPRQHRRPVTLSECVNTPDFCALLRYSVPLPLGVDTHNRPICTDLTKLPHLLIAGTTGSGKSVLLNSLLGGLLFNSFNRVKLLLIDLKRVEFEPYNGLPQLLAPIATTGADAVKLLQNACNFMDARYKRFEQLHVNNISQTDLPRVIIVIDELADLINKTDHAAEGFIVRLSLLGRAAGIHLILATQRPTVDTVTGQLKANLLARVALRVASVRDSVVILDHKGAERLTGAGDALVKLPDRVDEVRIQTPYTTADEINSLCEWWRKQNLS